MERELPVYIISNAPFTVDVEHLQLIENANPENRLRLRDMDYKDDSYHFKYNPSAGRMVWGLPDDAANIVEISLPPFRTLDPEGMAKKYNLTLAEVASKSDFDIIVDQGMVKRLSEGVEPVVEIAGDDFAFKYDTCELQLKNDPSVVIKLMDMDWDTNEDNFRDYYDVRQKKMHNYTDTDVIQLTSVPNDTVLVRVPGSYILNPVAYAKEHNEDLKNSLMKYPPVEKFRAEIIPIEKTRLFLIVSENQRIQKKQQQKTKRRSRRL